jgi:hypothetical protein
MAATDADLKVCRIASLTLTNAMIFQQVLAERHNRVQSLSRAVGEPHVAESLLKTWTFILEKIDYIPIFATANEIIKDLVGVPDADSALKRLGQAALRITEKRAALRHDLMGRIYHRLLAEAKYFGAFYTTVPAATLLLKLTLDPEEYSINWADLGEIEKLKIADLACGTGTLLKASLQTIVENHVRARAERGELPDLNGVHKILVENVLWGLDVVPFAIHLAGSALALHEPDVEFGKMNLYTLPIGGANDKLGSLDLLAGRTVGVQADMFGPATAPARVTGGGEVRDKINVPELDLCVMNPPFTRSVGGNLLFGHAPAKERARMQTALKKLVASRGVPANITAGLGSVFVAVGHRKLGPTGSMSLVLPRALLSGVAWADTRRLLGNSYHVKYIVVSHQPGSWNFSENTELSECLIVADWVGGDDVTKPTKVVNLWTKPKSSVEALTVASLIRQVGGASLGASGTDELGTPLVKYGEAVQVPAADIRRGNWNEGAAFAQTELCRAAHRLWGGEVYSPGEGVIGAVSLTKLKAIADIGPDRRDIHDGFKPTDQSTEYPAVWGHDTTSVQCMAQKPNKYLMALAHAKKGRNLRDAHLLWSRSGRLLVAERLWLTTTRLVAIRASEKVLSNTWWPIATDAPAIDKTLALWLNSTLGLLSLIASRVDTRGAWVDLKKPILEELAVIDPTKLRKAAQEKLNAAYDGLCKLEIQALPHMAEDAVRGKIDAVVADALGLKRDLSVVRSLLAAEPIISMRLPVAALAVVAE